MENDLAQDDGLLQEFVTESEEQLQRMEQDLLELESSTDPELVNRIFRAMHTIKGTSSFLGFDLLVDLTHHAEDLLNAMRRGEVRPTRAAADVLLTVCDRVRVMLGNISEKRELGGDDSALIAQIQEARTAVPRLGELLSVEPVVRKEEIASALEAAKETGEKIGQVLVDRGLATREQVERALEKQGVVGGVAEATTMRVEVKKLDSLVNLVGELAIERNRLATLMRELENGRLTLEQLQNAMSLATTRLNFLTEELQSASLSTRMVPIDAVFRRLPRMVREVAAALGRDVELVLKGQETEIDKTMVEQISDPLVHLVRNAVDHGIEDACVRVKAGKNAKGTLIVEARPEGDQIIVSVIDDGKGIDTARVLEKAVEKGLVTADRARIMTKREILDLIFVPGMSTAEKVNNISGRGVGMDVVRSNVKKLNGAVDLESIPGRGTTVRLRVPLTMAILPVLLVEVGNEIYALPLRSVKQTTRVEPAQVHRVEGREILSMRDRNVPLLRLSTLFGTAINNSGSQRAVVLAVGDLNVALLVDRLVGQESTVIKSMGNFLRDCPSVAGATISGDGRVRLVLDPNSLIATATDHTGAAQC